jgi:inorganic pyrophosphatase
MTLLKWTPAALLLALCSNVEHRPIVGGAPVAAGALAVDAETVIGARHFASGYPTRAVDGSVHAVVEIPSGTTAKFEVDLGDGALRWVHTREDDSRREVDYLAYPVNYGMIPRTLADDGDPLDVLVLGRGLERGRVARTRIIAVLKTGQDGDRDDKLIAVPIDADIRNGFSELRDIDELDRGYPELRAIVELWFANCWGRGATSILGWGGAAEAEAILDAAAVTGEPRRHAARDPRPRAALPFAGRGR